MQGGCLLGGLLTEAIGPALASLLARVAESGRLAGRSPAPAIPSPLSRDRTPVGLVGRHFATT